MRLNTTTIQLEEFLPDQIPPYAILSHTWETGEVLYTDIQSHQGDTKAAWSKVTSTCEQARPHQYQCLWIDTCGIDKSSSAELSESLNSMFTWYANASICYTYLADVSTVDDPHAENAEFERSKWFTRGWTLQELVASHEVIFFSRDWIEIGRKSTLYPAISRITNIDEEFLLRTASLESASVAKRMSWAAHRRTSRPEDIAYCLMGIFGVSMPMLYGEGAFLRLQEEIMKHSDDRSIFAWVDREAAPDTLHGLLATSPAMFAESYNIGPYEDWVPRAPYTMTNRGLQIDLPLTAAPAKGKDAYLASLDCFVAAAGRSIQSSFLAIELRRMSSVNDEYARTGIHRLETVYVRGQTKPAYVRQAVGLRKSSGITPHPVFQLGRIENPLLYELIGVFVQAGVHVKQQEHGPRPTEFVSTAETDPIHFYLVLETSKRLGVVITVGTLRGSDGPLGFSAMETTDPRGVTVQEVLRLASAFRPQPMGTRIALEHHKV